MIAAVVAIDNNYGIGYKNELLIQIPEDMKNFKTMTSGNTVIMGRKTFESIGSNPLPNRNNIVITSTANESVLYNESYGCFVTNMTGAINYLKRYNEKEETNEGLYFGDIYVIGGSQIYNALLPYCDYVYATKILKSFDCVDSYFPDIDFNTNWELSYHSEVKQHNNVEYVFLTYRKKGHNNMQNNNENNVFIKEENDTPIKENEESKEMVNHPDHYNHGGMECIDEMELIYGTEAVMHFCLCNMHKYRKRALFKNGKEDMKKSDWYMAKYKELIEKPEEQRKYPNK